MMTPKQIVDAAQLLTCWFREQGVERWELMGVQSRDKINKELLMAVKFQQSQIRSLANHAFSGEVDQWLAKCDMLRLRLNRH